MSFLKKTLKTLGWLIIWGSIILFWVVVVGYDMYVTY